MNPEVLDSFIKHDEALSPHRAYLEALIKPSVDILLSTIEAKNHESRFGGSPFVPEQFVWPTHEIGEYKFLGQINFSEIEDCPEGLPCQGLLSLFYAFDEDGEIFWGDDGYVLAYYWPNLEGLVLFPETCAVPEAKKILLRAGKEIPRHKELRDDWPFDTGVLSELRELKGSTEDYLLGYPSFYTLGYDPTPGNDWISLMTLSSHEEFDWCWHDGDKLMVFIEKSRLKNNDFSCLKVDAG